MVSMITAQTHLGQDLLTLQDAGIKHKNQKSTCMVVCRCAQLSAAPGPRSFEGSLISVNRLHRASWCEQQHGLTALGCLRRALQWNCIG